MNNGGTIDISVVMPLYNKGAEVGRAIRSVMAQTVSNFEIIVVNDGSTDTGPDEVRNIRDCRIRIIDQRNAGVSVARNRGIEEARADFIAFLDADDEWKPDFLETIMRLRRDFPTCDVFATAYYYSTSAGGMRPIFFSTMPDRMWEGIVDFHFAINSEFDPAISSSAIAVTKKAISSIGGFPLGITFGEDLLTWVRLLLNYDIAYSTHPCSIYWMPSSFRADRIPQSPDFIGHELERLMGGSDISRSNELREAAANWYRRRGIMHVLFGEKKKALDEIHRAIQIQGPNLDLRLLTAISKMPMRVAAVSLWLLKHVKALRRNLVSLGQSSSYISKNPAYRLHPPAAFRRDGAVPLFSVIVPLFNKESDVSRAIGSALSQTVGDFELIVINDGSTDAGPDIVRSIEDCRIRVIDQKNAGVSAARNRGIEEARAGLIAFLDADDEWKPDFLETILRLRSKFPTCDVFATNYFFCRKGYRSRPAIIKGIADGFGEGVLEDYFTIASNSEPPLWTSALAVTGDAIRSTGGFPVGVTAGEDLLTWARLALRYKIAYCAQAKACFWGPVGVPDRPKRTPDIHDVVGGEFALIARSVDPSRAVALRKYIALWHRMRAVVFIQFGEGQKAACEIKKAADYIGMSPKLYLLFTIAAIPGASSMVFKVFQRANALCRFITAR